MMPTKHVGATGGRRRRMKVSPLSLAGGAQLEQLLATRPAAGRRLRKAAPQRALLLTARCGFWEFAGGAHKLGRR